MDWYRSTCPGDWQDYCRLSHYYVYLYAVDIDLLLAVKPQLRFDPESRTIFHFPLSQNAPCKGIDALEKTTTKVIVVASGNYEIHLYTFELEEYGGVLERVTEEPFIGKHPRLFSHSDGTLLLMYTDMYNARRFVLLNNGGVPQTQYMTFRKLTQTLASYHEYIRGGVPLMEFIQTMDYWQNVGEYI